MFVHILFCCPVRDGTVKETNAQSRELYHCGCDLANRWPKDLQWGGGGGLSQSMFFKMDEYLKKVSTLQSM
jgi:hypothetical protein